MKLRATIVLALLFVARTLEANELKLSATRIHLDESVQLTVTLTGRFAELDDIDLVLENLVIETGPRTSAEFTWINGVANRRRSFIYTLRGKATGAASVGPIVITNDDGVRDTLGPTRLEILGDSTVALGGDPTTLLRHYAATSRARVAVGAELNRERAVVGEQVIATWYLYTAESTESVSVTAAPPLSDFWVEEITVNRASDTELMVDGMPVRKVPLRRAAIYPLHAGLLTIPPLEVNAEVMEVIGGVFDRFGMMNTRTAPVRRRSKEMSLEVGPSPLGQVGSYTIRCTNPQASAAGPVAFDVTLTGDGNLRAAQPPRFIAPPDAEVQITPGEMKVDKSGERVSMQRSWRYLLFPRRSGMLAIPSVNFDYFDPRGNSARLASCTFSPFEVKTFESREEAGESVRSTPSGAMRFALPLSVGVLLFAAGGYLLARKRRGRRRLDEHARAILSAETPFELRRRFDELLGSAKLSRAALMVEASERGELTRAVSSLIEYRIQQPAHAPELDDELHERLVELIAALG